MNIPYSIEAEKAILGSIILWPEMMSGVSTELDRSDFYSPVNARCYGILKNLYVNEKIIDPVCLLDHGVKPEYLEEITKTVSTTETINYHIKVIKNHSIQRKLIRICNEAITDLKEKTDNIEEKIASIIGKIQSCYKKQLDIKNLKETVQEFAQECEERYRNPEEAKPLGIPTGIITIDNALCFGGLPKGHITIIAAETSTGKSAFAQTFIRYACFLGYKGIHATLEDYKESATGRHISAMSGIPNRQIQRKIIGENEWNNFISACSKISLYGENVIFIDEQTENIETLILLIERIIQREGNIEYVVFDYIQLINSGQKYKDKQSHIDYVLDKIVQFSRRNKGIACVIVSQTKRLHGSRPNLDNLYHSAMLEQASNTVILLWRPKIKEEIDCIAVDIAKQKDGPVGIRIVGWNGQTVNFFNANEYDIRRYKALIENIKEK